MLYYPHLNELSVRTLTFCILLLLIGLQYKLWFGEGSMRTLHHLKKKSAEQMQLNETMALKNQSIKANIDELKSGEEALEEEARQDLGMVKSDETYYQFIE